MATKTLPWEYHPELTEERIVAVATLIADARQTAVELYDELAGDDGWTLGCRASQFGRARILRAGDNAEYPWLHIVDRTRRLVFTIGGVPVRIYRGEPEEPTVRTLRQSNNELRQLSFSFDRNDEGRDLAYRFAVETGIDGNVASINFVGLRDTSVVLNWSVPVDRVTGVGAVGVPATVAVELDAPVVGVRDRAADSVATQE